MHIYWQWDSVWKTVYISADSFKFMSHKWLLLMFVAATQYPAFCTDILYMEWVMLARFLFLYLSAYHLPSVWQGCVGVILFVIFYFFLFLYLCLVAFYQVCDKDVRWHDARCSLPLFCGISSTRYETRLLSGMMLYPLYLCHAASVWYLTSQVCDEGVQWRDTWCSLPLLSPGVSPNRCATSVL